MPLRDTEAANFPYKFKFTMLQKYAKLSQDEKWEESETPSLRLSRRNWTLSIALTILITAVAGLLCFIYTHSWGPLSKIGPTSPSSIGGCGHTIAEATAAGCTFDYLAHLWLPKQCSRSRNDDYITFDEGRPFEYWLDGDGQKPTDMALQPYGTPIFSTTQEHLVHCALTLLRTSDWMRNGGHWERKVLSPGHFEHCVVLLLNATHYHPELYEINSFTRLGFSGECYGQALDK